MTHFNDGALQHYRRVGAEGGVESSDPHQLIVMLMNGALDAIASGKGHMARGEVSAKGRSISRAIAIIEGLRGSLDPTVNNKMVANLDELYQYMGRRLLQANLSDDTHRLDEVASLLREIRSAWIAIPPDLRRARPTESELEQAAV